MIDRPTQISMETKWENTTITSWKEVPVTTSESIKAIVTTKDSSIIKELLSGRASLELLINNQTR